MMAVLNIEPCRINIQPGRQGLANYDYRCIGLLKSKIGDQSLPVWACPYGPVRMEGS